MKLVSSSQELIFFNLSADFGSEKETKLLEKVEKIISENNLWHPKNTGFIGLQYGSGIRGIFTKIVVKAGFTKFTPIYRISGFYTADNANPKKSVSKMV